MDSTDTFAPVTKMVTVRTLLSIAPAWNWHIHQMDMHNAFFHGNLLEEVYMQPLHGFHTSSPRQVCRAEKFTLWTMRGPRCWFFKLTTALHMCGFTQSYADYSFFTYKHEVVFLCVLIYVDDLLITSNRLSSVLTFKGYLNSYFHMKDLGLIKYFLGIKIAQNPSSQYLSQRKYALEIIVENGLMRAKPAFHTT